MKLTQAAALALSIPVGKKDHFIWDDDLKGFGVRLRPSKAVWVVQYRHGTQQRRLTLGDVRKVDAVKARKAAKDRLAAVQLGADPQQEKVEARARAGITLGGKVEIYLVERAQELRPNSLRAVTRYLRNHWRPLHGMALHRIGRFDVAARVAELKVKSGAVAATQARTALSSFFAWAIGEGLCDVNPVIGSNRPSAATKRTRVLADWELRAIWGALRNDDYGRIVKLAMITGQRREEISGMMWPEIDFDASTWEIPKERSKNHRSHKIPLSDIVLEIIRGIPQRVGRNHVFGEGPHGFSGYSAGKRALDERIVEARDGEALAHWVLHDLRRTCNTGMGKLGVLPHVADEVLGHIGPHKSGVQGVYNQAQYEREVRAALTLWAAHVLSVVEGPERKVVSFSRPA
jgi:integrase